MIELIAPAGDLETLKIAIYAGADAVYIGGNKFGARLKARNFSIEELKEAIRFAHALEKKVYITVNTLIKNSEYMDALEFIANIYKINADAVIVQNPSLGRIIKNNFKDMEVHASTQMTLHNSDSIEYLSFLDRITLARELSKKQVNEIITDTEKPIEIFVHGALCRSVSGQCLMSSIIGQRSGNRGFCAQPCRKPYMEKFKLSTADLCLIDNIPEIIQMGIHSVKIEGRLKSKEYVGAVVSIYRKAIDSFYNGSFEISREDRNILFDAFNRTFTKGYFGGESIKATDNPGNRGKDFSFQIIPKRKKIKVKIEVSDTIRVKVGSIILEEKTQIPVTNSTSKKDILKIFTKTKNTPIEFNCEIDMKKQAFIPFSLLTELKNQLINRLMEECNRDVPKMNLPNIKKITPRKSSFAVKVHSINGIFEAKKAKVEYIYYNIFSDDIKEASKHDVYFEIPMFTPNKKIKRALNMIDKLRPKGILIANPALLKHDFGLDIHLNYNFNIMNDYQIAFWGKKSVISPELNLKEILNFQNKDFFVFAHGNLIVMNILDNINGLRDEKRAFFRTRVNPAGYIEVLNSKETGILRFARILAKNGVKQFYFDLEKNVFETLDIYKKIINGSFDDSKIKGKFTTGHLKRGV